MKEKFINSTHVEGYLYAHKLEKRLTGENSKTPGVEYIRGTVDVATDEECTNIVTVNYTYVASNHPSTYVQDTYAALNSILSGALCSVSQHGKDRASLIRLDSAIGINDFYTERNGADELVSAKRNDGGFVRTTASLIAPLAEDPKTKVNPRAKFDCDMLITKAVRMEADEEHDVDERVILGGYVFSFRKEIIPVEFVVYYPPAMNYFESLEPTSKVPVFTHVSGSQVSTIITRKRESANAWGEIEVKETQSSRKEWVVTWATPDVYEWDTDGVLLGSEVKEMLAARETHLAETKASYLARKAAKSNPPSAFSNATVTASAVNSAPDFDF